MKTHAILTMLAATCLVGPALADGDLSRADVIDVMVELGSNDGAMYIKPDAFEFRTGQAYNLVLTNADEIKHELSLNEMGERIFTRKIEIEDDAGALVAEIKGMIREIEVGPHQTVQWFIVPVQTIDEPVEITCELPGHYDAGMKATVVIK